MTQEQAAEYDIQSGLLNLKGTLIQKQQNLVMQATNVLRASNQRLPNELLALEQKHRSTATIKIALQNSMS
jgi:hypothetical protein